MDIVTILNSFKRKAIFEAEDWRNSKDYWKAPILESEYGEYDYFATKLPENTDEWITGRKRCESCGKYHYFSKRTTAYFYTMDGYDSMDYTECWRCWWRTKKMGFKNKIRKEVKKIISKSNICKFIKTYMCFKKANIPHPFEMAKKSRIVRNDIFNLVK